MRVEELETGIEFTAEKKFRRIQQRSFNENNVNWESIVRDWMTRTANNDNEVPGLPLWVNID